MARKKNTRRALFSSVISLILCFAMLVGTTFAWFTDSVSTANNLIQSGNLDIELYWSKDCASWEAVNTSTNVFEKEALWEPGYTEIVYLKAVNEGALNLKYQLGANVVSEVGSINKNEESFKLSDYIQYGVAETTTKFADRTTAQNALSGATSLASPYSSDIITLAPKAEKIVALVVYMPESVGNEANYQTGATVPQIVLGLNVMATQVEAEMDSFGNDYDLDATLPEGTLSAPTTASSNVREDGSVALNVAAAPSENTKLTTVEAPANTYDEGQTVEMSVSTVNTLFNITANGADLAKLDITLSVDGVKQKGEIDGLYTVTTYISTGLNNDDVIVSYVDKDGNLATDKDQPTKISYDSNTGKLVFTTNHFSTYNVSGKGYGYETTDDHAYTTIPGVIQAINNNERVIVPEEHKAEVFAAADSSEEVKKQLSSASVNGNYYFTLEEAVEASTANSEISVKAGTYTFPAGSVKAGSTLTCEEGTVFDGTSKLNINGSTVIGATFSNPTGTAAEQTINGTFKDCTFTGSNGLRWCYAGETVVFENCVFDGSTYGVHFDGGANSVVFKNCTFSGFNAMGGAITQLTMENCTFKSTGKSSYNGINLWGSTEMKNCTFVFDGKAATEWVDVRGSNKTVNFTDCKVTDGTTTKGIETVVGDSGAGNKITIDGTVWTAGADTLGNSLAAGEDVTLSENVTLESNVVVCGGTLDGNGKTITDNKTNSNSDCAVTTTGGTVKNVTITGEKNATRAIGAGSTGKTTLNEDLYIDNVTIDNVMYAINGSGNGTSSVYVTNSTIYGWNSFSNIKLFSFDNCTLGKGNSYDGYQVIYGDTSYTNCTFETFDMCADSSCPAGSTVTFTNCTNDGQKVTAENFKTLFMYPGDDEDFGKLLDKCNIIIDGVSVAFNVSNMTDVLADGGNVVLTEDITTNKNAASGVAYGNAYGVSVDGGTLDGNGKTISAGEDVKYTVVVNDGAVKNATINSGERGIVTYAPTSDIVIDNVIVNGPGYALNSAEHGAVKLIVNNSTLNGWTSFDGFESAAFTNCKFGENTTHYWKNMGYDSVYDRLIKPYVNTSLTNCAFEMNFYIDLSSLGEGCKVTLNNCTVNGTVITVSNYTQLLEDIELPSWATEVTQCVNF